MLRFLIETDGTVVTDQAVVEAARIAIEAGGADVVALDSPLTPREPALFVGWIDDWGVTKGRPVNMKAWALYGRSPIHGPMVVANDLGFPVGELAAKVSRPIEEWVAPEILDRMRELLGDA
jgi:hypothetical protein